MSWATARAELAQLLDGATIESDGMVMDEQLSVSEWPPQLLAVDSLPVAWIWPPARTITHPPMQRFTAIRSCRLEVALGNTDSFEQLARRMDLWVEALAERFDSAIGLNGIGNVPSWEVSELRQSAMYEGLWGFDIAIELELYEAKANDA